MTPSPTHGAPGLTGIWPALMTPLDADLAIDHPRFAAHARALIEAGCQGVTPFGTTGEGPSFSVAERRAAVDALIAGGVAPSRILVSASCAALPDTLALVRHAQDVGAWGVLLMPPFFFKGVSDEGIVAFYRQVLEASTDRDAIIGSIHTLVRAAPTGWLKLRTEPDRKVRIAGFDLDIVSAG